MTKLREEQQELEAAIKAADNLTRNRLNELGQLTVKYFRLLDRALKENESLKTSVNGASNLSEILARKADFANMDEAHLRRSIEVDRVRSLSATVERQDLIDLIAAAWQLLEMTK